MDKFKSYLHNAYLPQLALMPIIGLIIACTSLQESTPIAQYESTARVPTSIADDSAGVPRPQKTGYDIRASDLPVLSNTAMPVAVGTTYYVSRRGSNGDGRSWATAWNELDQINWSVIQPGDAILIDGGEKGCDFPVAVTDNSNEPAPVGCGMVYKTTLTIAASGTANAPITIRLADEPGRDGTARLFCGRSQPLGYSGQNGYILQPANESGIYLNGQSYIVVDGQKWAGMMIYGCNRNGIWLAHEREQRGLTFRNAEIFDNGYMGREEPDGQGIDPNGTYLSFERMIVHDNGQDAFQTGYGTSAQQVTLRRSWLYNQRPHPTVANEPFNYTKHSDGIQIYGGHDLHGLFIEDSIIGPGLMQGLILGGWNQDGNWATVHDVTIRNSLLVSHHGGSSNAGLLTVYDSNINGSAPSNYQIDHVTVVRDQGARWHNMWIQGSGHQVTNSVFYGGIDLIVEGWPRASGNFNWLVSDNSNIATEANPMFVDSDFAGVGPGFADFDFTITNPALPRGVGASITSVSQLLGDFTPPTAWINDLPSQSECSNVRLSWAGSDPAPGTGVRSFDVQISDNGGAWTSWLQETQARNAVYAGGAYSHTVGFQVRARDQVGNVGSYSAARYTSIVDTISPYRAKMSALSQAQKAPFEVYWGGADACSSVTFDVEYRVGASQTWTRWLTATSDTHAMFYPESPQYGQRYDFRVRVQDEAGNSTESDPVSTILAKYTLSGDIVTIRHEPVVFAQVTVTDGVAAEATFGHYIAYVVKEGNYDLLAARYGFGTLPPMHLTSVVTDLSGLYFVLSPQDDAIDNGDFEAAGWGSWLSGGAVMPDVISGGHTGDRAARLGGTGGTSWLGQDLSVPGELVDAALSFLVRPDDAAAGLSTLTVELAGTPISQTPVVSAAVWTQVWLPIDAAVGHATTLTFTVTDSPAVRLDEVRLGSAIFGGAQVQLPLVFQASTP